MSGVVFLDLETTGLDPERHEIWEFGLIAEDGIEHVFRRRPKNGADADPGAIRITDFYHRTTDKNWVWDNRTDPVLAGEIALLVAGKHLVGAVPSFDAAFLAAFLRANGQCPAWHYHLVDVEALVAGKLGIAPPWDSADLSRRIGINPGQYRKHEALEDARWAKALYEAVLPAVTVDVGDRLGTLDAAWAAVEAALPGGWRLGGLRPAIAFDGHVQSVGSWGATAHSVYGIGREDPIEGRGPTPTAALLALAERLAQR